MTVSNTLRGVAVVAILAALAVVWLAHRTVQRAEESNQWIVHTQAVLTAIDAIGALVGDADSAAHSYTRSVDARSLEPLDRAERTSDDAVSRLAALTTDNPSQQGRIPQLRQGVTRLLVALRRLTDAKRAAPLAIPVDTDRVQVSLEAVRGTIRAARAEENGLMADRVRADQAAIARLEGISDALIVTTVGLAGWILWLTARGIRRDRHSTDSLRRAKKHLEGQVDARSADLRESNERLRSIIDSAVDGIIVIDSKGTIESFNRGAERLFGYGALEVLGRNVNMLMPSPYHEEHDTYLTRHLATGVQKIIGTGREVTGLRRDGTTFPLHLSVGKLTVGGERKFTGILHDLTARVQMEEQLREQTSLAKLGEMAAVIAHEVKNPLAGMRGALQIIGRRLPQGGQEATIVQKSSPGSIRSAI